MSDTTPQHNMRLMGRAMAVIQRFRLHDRRWIPWLLTIAYASLGGMSFQFFHEFMLDAAARTSNPTLWVYFADSAYTFCTVLLISLLISWLLSMLNAYESTIERSEERFRKVIETTRDWVWEVDENLRYTYVSPMSQSLLGIDASQIVGKTPFDLMPVDDLRSVRDLLHLLVVERQAYHMIELHYLHQDGHRIVVESTGAPIYDRKGVFRGFRGIDRDVTERKQSEQALERSYDFYRSLFDDFPLPIWRSGTDGRIIYYNQAGQALLGKPLDEATFQLGTIGRADVKYYESAYKQAVKYRQPFTLTYRLCRYDGVYTLISHTGQPCYDTNGNYLGYIGYFLEVDKVRHAAIEYEHSVLN